MLIELRERKEKKERRGILTTQSEIENSWFRSFGRDSDGLGLWIRAGVSWVSVGLGCGLGLQAVSGEGLRGFGLRIGAADLGCRLRRWVNLMGRVHLHSYLRGGPV